MVGEGRRDHMKGVARVVIAASMIHGGALSAATRSYQVGVGGWVFERFGSDVAILRAPATSESARGKSVGLFMSCSGSDRRFRLTFPKPMTDIPDLTDAGLLMITEASLSRPDHAAVARFAWTKASTLGLSQRAAAADIVQTIGRIMLSRSRGIDLLISFGREPAVLTRLSSYRLFMTVSSSDLEATKSFLAACDPTSVGRIH